MGRRPAARALDLRSRHGGSDSRRPLQESKALSAGRPMPPPPRNARVLTCRGDEGQRSGAQAPGDNQHRPWRACWRPGRRSASRRRLPTARGARLSRVRTGLGRLRESSGVSRRHREVMRAGESYVTLGPSRAVANPAVGVCPTPSPLSKWGPRAQRGRDWIPGSSLPRNSPRRRPRPSLRGGEQSARMFTGPGTGVGSGEPVLPRPTRREFEFPGIKVAARPAAGSERGAGSRPGAQDGRKPRAPAAGDGRAGNKWFSGSGRDPTAPTFPTRGGRRARRRRGERGGKGRCAALGTVCVCGAAPRRASGSALRRIGPRRPPAQVLATAASRCRREGSSAARRTLWGPLGPSANLWPLAGRNFRRAAGSDETRPKRPEARHPRAPCPGRPAPTGSAPGRRRTRLLAENRARSPHPSRSRAAAAAQVRDQLSLASSAPRGPRHPDPAS